jgi:WD40 repeat protein
MLGRWISPGGLGCAIVTLIVGMLIALVAGKDIFRFLADGKVVDTMQPTATAMPVPPRSLILLGTSPDGVAYYFNNPMGIFYRDSGSISTSIATLPAFEASHWSPQENKIAFIVQDRNDTLPLLYVLDLANPPSDGQLGLVTKRDPDGFPAEFGLRAESPVAWSQDEQYIAFVAYDQTGKATLFVSEVATGKVRRLTEGTEPVTSVAWEKYRNDQDVDDEQIVYVLIRDGRELIYSVEKDGAENNPWRH